MTALATRPPVPSDYRRHLHQPTDPATGKPVWPLPGMIVGTVAVKEDGRGA